MLLTELVLKLHERGFPQANRAKCGYAIRCHFISQPRMNPSGFYEFDDESIEEFARYFAAPKKTRRERLRSRKEELATA